MDSSLKNLKNRILHLFNNNNKKKRCEDFFFLSPTVKLVYYVRGQFAAFLAFNATDQRHIIILLFETLLFWFL